MAGLPIFRSQVSAIRIQARVIRFRFGAGINRFSPLSTIQSSVHFGWPVAAPGGRWQAFPFGPPFSPQRSPPFSPPDRFSPLSSVIDSAIYSFRVAGGRLFHSALHSAIHSFLHSALRDRFSPLSSVIDSAIDPLQVAGGGRDVIAITSAGGRTTIGSASLPDATPHPLRTAAMAMAALPDQLQYLLGQQRHA